MIYILISIQTFLEFVFLNQKNLHMCPLKEKSTTFACTHYHLLPLLTSWKLHLQGEGSGYARSSGSCAVLCNLMQMVFHVNWCCTRT